MFLCVILVCVCVCTTRYHFSTYLRDKVLLELGEELQVEKIIGRQGLFTDDGLHRLHVLTDGVASVLWRKRAY